MKAEDSAGNARETFVGLMNSMVNGETSVEKFCGSFETAYNFHVDLDSLVPADAEIFSTLFDVVTRFSPYPEEREQISFYVGETEVLRAIREALTKLQQT